MRRFAIPLTVTVTLAIAVTLFHLKQQFGDMEKELAQVNRTIATHREMIKVMRSEWTYLNRPAWIAEMAKKHLGMEHNGPARLIHLSDLPPRALDRIPSQTELLAQRARPAASDQGELQ